MDVSVSKKLQNKQDMKLVIAGYVDHGKSTIIGRLLADTDSLPEGKLEQVIETCRRNSKPFEYAFLLDALNDEQAQGITIDAARIGSKIKTDIEYSLNVSDHKLDMDTAERIKGLLQDRGIIFRPW